MKRLPQLFRCLGKLLVLSSALVLLPACVPTSRIKPVQTLAEVQAGETLLVGRIELVPPLKPGEQKLSDTYREYDRLAVVIVGDVPREMHSLGLGDLKQRINAPFGQHFFVSHPTQPFYILKSWVVMNAKIEVGSGNAGRPADTTAPLEGIFRVDLRPGDKAVYIGTIRYHRDEFFGTTKVVVGDDYASANAEFQRRYGTGISLRKSLAVAVARR